MGSDGAARLPVASTIQITAQPDGLVGSVRLHGESFSCRNAGNICHRTLKHLQSINLNTAF